MSLEKISEARDQPRMLASLLVPVRGKVMEENKEGPLYRPFNFTRGNPRAVVSLTRRVIKK